MHNKDFLKKTDRFSYSLLYFFYVNQCMEHAYNNMSICAFCILLSQVLIFTFKIATGEYLIYFIIE